MTVRALARPAALAGMALLAASTPSPGRVSVEGPIPGFSGGFGEATCAACHFDGELNEAPGRLVLTGIPERYAPGQSYAITIMLTRPGIAVGGFQLTARFEEDGAQAGSLAIPKADGRLTVTTDRGVEYAHHLRPGTALARPDTARWAVLWTAPVETASGSGGGTVALHVAANAGDGDESQLGDRIYTAVVRSALR